MRKVFLVLGVAVLALAPVATASSHREAPAITEDPTADNTDVYAFVSYSDPNKVTLISNFVPLELPYGGPNFYKFSDTALYEIMIDNNGDAKEDVTFQFSFKTTNTAGGTSFLYNNGVVDTLNDVNLLVYQTYTVTRVDGDRRTGTKTVIASGLYTEPNRVGPASMPSYLNLYNAAQYSLTGGYRSFAGPVEEGFYVDLAHIFDLLQVQATGVDGTAGANVHSIAFEAPIDKITACQCIPPNANDPNAVIGVWSSASRVTTFPGCSGCPIPPPIIRQVSRLGAPLVNEVVIPRGKKNSFNQSVPSGDGQFLSYVQNSELATLLNALFGLSVPPAPRNDLVTVFLTGVPGLNQPLNVVPSEQLRLNVKIPPCTSACSPFGVIGGDNAGYPNGRRPGDDVVDISLRVVAGFLVGPPYNQPPNSTLSDGVQTNDAPYPTTFPFQAMPFQPY